MNSFHLRRSLIENSQTIGGMILLVGLWEDRKSVV